MRSLSLVIIQALFMSSLAQADNPRSPQGCDRADRFGRAVAARKDIDPKCAAALAKADRCCKTDNLEACGFKDNGFGDRKDLPKSGVQGSALQEAQRLIKSGNRHRAALDYCKHAYSLARADCLNVIRESYYALSQLSFEKKPEDPKLRMRAKDHDELVKQVESEGRSYVDCIGYAAKAQDADVEKALRTANASGQGDWTYSCRGTSEENNHRYLQCTLVDKSANEGEFVRDEAREALEVKSVSLEKCTGFPDASGRLITADHCVGTVDEDKYALRANEKHDLGAHLRGQVGRDAAVYDPKAPVSEEERGRPFYYMARDDSVGSGCELKGQILACSPSSMRELQGQLRAEIQGVPGAYFENPDNRLDHARDVLVTRGPAFYDENTRSVQVNAYVSPGNSGGPAYFRSGTNIGGVVTDRPVIIGPVSAATNIQDRHEISGSLRFALIPLMSREQVEALYIPQVASGTLLEGVELFRH